MQLDTHLDTVRAQLIAAAALGDDQAKRVAEVLATAAAPAVRLAVLGALTDAADEITAALLDQPSSPSVSVRIDGTDVRLDVQVSKLVEAEEPDADAGDATARISFRLTEQLKTDIDAAARADAISVNTWLTRAAAATIALRQRSSTSWPNTDSAGRGRGANRITGWVNG